MSAQDRVEAIIAAVSPRWAARRATARVHIVAAKARETMLSSFVAAERSRLTADWPARVTSADQAILPDAATLLARARDAVYNDWAAASIVQGYRRHVVGSGITVRPDARDEDGEPLEEFNRKASRRWARWSSRPSLCDFEWRKTFVEIQGLCASEMVTVGEAFAIRMIERRGDESPLSIRVVEPEMLARDLHRSPARRDNEVRGGIEVDRYNRPLGLWLQQFGHALEWARPSAPTFVPMSAVCHLFRQERPQQSHGVSKLASILQKLWHLRMYNQYQIVRARYEAAIGMVIETTQTAPSFGGGIPSIDVPEERADGSLNITMEPGMAAELPPGKTAKFHSPTTPGGTYAPFVTQQLKEVAAGAGTDHPTLLRDFTQGSFSAQRQAMLERDKETDPLQDLLIGCLVRPIYEDFIIGEIISGRLDAPEFFRDPEAAERYLSAGYHTPPKPWIDPSKQAAAAKIALEQRLETRAAIIAERYGADWRQVFDQIDDEQEYAETLGIGLPDAPSARGGVGSPPTSPVEPRPEQDEPTEPDFEPNDPDNPQAQPTEPAQEGD